MRDTPKARSAAERFPLIFEAAKRTLLGFELLLDSLSERLPDFEACIDEHRPIAGPAAADALISAMGLIDFAHRYGQLVDALPILNKKLADPRALRERLEPVESARHYFQHMRGDLNVPHGIDYPILGALAWTKGAKCYTFAFSQAGSAKQGSPVWDRSEGKFLTDLQYSVKGIPVDLRATHSAMRRAYEWICKSIEMEPVNALDLTWGETLAVWMKFEEASGT